MVRRRTLVPVLFAAAVAVAWPVSPAHAATLTVTTAADAGAGSLRQAILDANATPVLDAIEFAIGNGAQTITLAGVLPAITAPVAIDGTTQPGYAGTPLITLDGVAQAFSCMVVGGKGGTTIKALHLQNCYVGIGVASGTNTIQLSALRSNLYGIVITGGANVVGGNGNMTLANVIGANGTGVLLTGKKAKGNFVRFNLIGTDAAGANADTNTYGVRLDGGASGTAVDGNVISGNTVGLDLDGAKTSANVLNLNYVGTDLAGTTAIANGTGVILVGATKNWIFNNVISGNSGDGLLVYGGARGNEIGGNRVGLEAGGSAALGNGDDGIELASPGNHLFANYVSGNADNGVELTAGGNLLSTNRIGTNLPGTAAVPNGGYGIGLSAGPNVIGIASGGGNLISGNALGGIRVQSAGNRIQDNRIGTNAAASAAIPNGGHGIYVSSSGTVIGGAKLGLGNVISGNTNSGIRIDTGLENVVQGNLIGLGANGTTAIGNGARGVLVASDENTIGGTKAPARNVIANNGGEGVSLNGSFNIVQGNYIGTDSSGVTAAPNSIGVAISGGANLIGGAKGAANRISGNTGSGVAIFTGDENRILGNSISGNGALGIDLDDDGVTANDPGDPDGGPNNRVNFPALTSAVTAAGKTTVTGTYHSIPDRKFRLEFFSNPACDASAYGEGQGYLGGVSVKTDGSGNASFSAALTNPGGSVITATATFATGGGTSEFSACAS